MVQPRRSSVALATSARAGAAAPESVVSAHFNRSNGVIGANCCGPAPTRTMPAASVTTAAVVGRLSTPPTAAPTADRSRAPMRTPATSPDGVTTGMLRAITGSGASRGSTTTPDRCSVRRFTAGATKRAATGAPAAPREVGATAPARGQHVARRVGQQQAGESRPEPLLLRQRQRPAGGDWLIAARVGQACGDGAQRRFVLGDDVADPVADQPHAVGELRAGAALGGPGEQAAQTEPEQGQRDRRQRDELMEQLGAQPLRLGPSGLRAQPLHGARAGRRRAPPGPRSAARTATAPPPPG